MSDYAFGAILVAILVIDVVITRWIEGKRKK